MIGGIYKITNLVSNKYYVGSTCDFSARWKKHQKKLEKNQHCNGHLQNAWNKYGKSNFIFTTVGSCDRSILLDEEQKWLNIAKSEPDKTYNITFIAGGGNLGEIVNKKISNRLKMCMSGKGNPMFGRKHSEETKRQWSDKRKGKFAGILNPNYGKPLSEERKKAISLAKSKKIWKFISPTGEVLEFSNLSSFCKNNGLSKTHMGLVHCGKSSHHKQWKSVA